MTKRPDRQPAAASRIIDTAAAALLCLALLLPVGDAPWFSFWREWVASAAVALLALGLLAALRDLRCALRFELRSVPTLALALAALCWLQFAFGRVPYLSDALLPSLYLAAFALCWVSAASLPQAQRDALADRLAVAMLAAAALSAPIAVLQWLGRLTLDLGVPVLGGRPVAHMEQANLLCSLLIQGLAGLWRLQARGRLARWPTALGVVLLLPVIVLTQSRVALVVAASVVAVVAWRRELVPMRPTGRIVIGLSVLVFAGAALLPALDASLGIAGASLADRSSAGRRPAMWALFVDAIGAQPLLGWGVLQNGAAQFAFADRHPSLGWYFSSAHNVVLDLALWFGVPLGLFAGGALYAAAANRLARASSAAQLATAFAASALLLHALVELPLHYAYFLLPLGLLLGATTPAAKAAVGQVQASVWPVALALPSAIVLGAAAHEYVALTDVRPVLAIDRATGHLLLTVDSPVPDVRLLDRLRAFHAFAAIPLRAGLPTEALDQARTVMLSTPFAPVIERAALISGLNGRRKEAEQALARLCRFEDPRACDESARAWELWREQWPELPPWPGPSRPASAEQR